MTKPVQGPLDLLDDPAAQQLLRSTNLAHLGFNWTDGTPRTTPIWFHWTGKAVVVASPVGAPKEKALHGGERVAVTIDDPTFPYKVLMLRGPVQVDEVDGVAAEYRAAAVRYFGEDAGNGWCDQLPVGTRMRRYSVTPDWVGLLDFVDMRRAPSALA